MTKTTIALLATIVFLQLVSLVAVPAITNFIAAEALGSMVVKLSEEIK